jgi:hypothetical protein
MHSRKGPLTLHPLVSCQMENASPPRLRQNFQMIFMNFPFWNTELEEFSNLLPIMEHIP